MENIFKSSGCEEEAQNPLSNAISSLMISNPSEHMIHDIRHQEMMQDLWEEAEAQQHSHEEQLWQIQPNPEEIWEEEKQEPDLEEEWNQAEEEFADDFLKEEDYKEELDGFLQEWNNQNKANYAFSKDNKYADTQNCYELAKEKEKSGETHEAILMLEAEVQNHPEHSEAWGLLGKLHAKNDEDTRAIAAMLRGLEIDPYNLDLLMSLGISCTNEFDEEQALNFLKTWVKHHPLYSEIPVDHSKNFREDIIEAFKVAVSINGQDPDVYQALGVLYYLSSSFDLAEENFRATLMLRQDDAAVWNRLGAALAKQNKTQEAFECYHKALEMRPDFVRTWGNLGLAYASIKDYETCARFYLCALSLNPHAHHLYNYLTTAFIMMNRFDLMEKLALRDPSVFSNEFDIITRDTLPKSTQWVYEFDAITRNTPLKSDEWAEEFK